MNNLKEIVSGNIKIDICRHTVSISGKKIELTTKEFSTLQFLAEHPGWVFSKRQIYENVWKEEAFEFENAIMCCISQLRKKIESDSRHPNYIHTVRGVGYKFESLSGE